METFFHAGLSNAVTATVLAMGVACLSRLLARRPAVLHCLWLLVLLKLVTPPMYEVPLPRPALWKTDGEPTRLADADVALAVAEVEVSVEELVIESDPDIALLQAQVERVPEGALATDRPAIDWLRLLMTIWLGGTVVVLIISFQRVRRFQRLLGEARPVPEDLQDWVSDLASRIGLQRSPIVEWVRARLSPMIWPLGWRPRLILPRDLWKTLDERQRSTLVVHELAHLRRGDHVIRFFELFVTALFWWHPVVWWVRHSLRDTEEHCCDAWVVWAFPDAARSYAETLLETIDFLNHSQEVEPLLASGFGKVHHLRRRLTMILSGTTPRLLGIRGALGLLGLAVVLLPLNATWAQKPEKPKEVEVVVKTLEDVVDKPQAVDIGTDSDDLVLVTAKPETVDVSEDETQMILKVDDGPVIEVSGPIDQAIVQLKKRIAGIQMKNGPSEQDQKQLKALSSAIEELAKVRKQIEGANSGSNKPSTRRIVKHVVIGRRDEASPRKPLSDEQKAEAEKLRGAVKTLKSELEAMAKQLAEAQAKLDKIEGTHSSASVVLHRVEGQHAGHGAGHGESHAVVIHRLEAQRADGKSPKAVEPKKVEGVIKRVEPIQRKIELKIASDAVLKLDKSAKPIELRDIKGPGDSEQQRIEELEKTLKKLMGEVEHLKKERGKAPEAR